MTLYVLLVQNLLVFPCLPQALKIPSLLLLILSFLVGRLLPLRRLRHPACGVRGSQLPSLLCNPVILQRAAGFLPPALNCELFEGGNHVLISASSLSTVQATMRILGAYLPSCGILEKLFTFFKPLFPYLPQG